MTCSLEKVRGNFVDVVKDIEAAQAASATLNPEQDFADTRKSVSSLEDQLAAIVKSTDALLATDPAATDPQLAKIADQLDAAKKSLTDSGTAIDGIKTSVGTIHTDAATSQTQAAAMVKQNADLVTALCQAVTDGALTPDRSLLLLAYLTPTGCDGKDLPVTPGLTPMSDQLQKQADAWQKLVDSTDTAKTDDGLGRLLDQAATGITDASTAVGKASTELDRRNGNSQGRERPTPRLRWTHLKTLDTGLGTIQTNYTAAKATLDAALKDAHDKASDVSSTNLDSAIAQISQQGQASSAQLGTAFENSAAGLESAALALQNSGTKAITQQRSVLIQTKKDASSSLSAATSDSLDQISGSVTSASRDLREHEDPADHRSRQHPARPRQPERTRLRRDRHREEGRRRRRLGGLPARAGLRSDQLRTRLSAARTWPASCCARPRPRLRSPSRRSCRRSSSSCRTVSSIAACTRSISPADEPSSDEPPAGEPPGAAGILAALGLMLTVGTTACGPSAPTTAAAPAVSAKLTGSLPDQLSIGVVVSVTSAPGEGTEWRDAAEGAQVAAERFALAGEKVTLVPANDKGTSEGAVAAVKSLAGRKVAGIVLATAGRHIDGALQEAAQRDVPVLLPYAGSAANLATDAGWLTGPSAASADQRLVELLRDRKLTRPLLIDAGGGSVDGSEPGRAPGLPARRRPGGAGQVLGCPPAPARE